MILGKEILAGNALPYPDVSMEGATLHLNAIAA